MWILYFSMCLYGVVAYYTLAALSMMLLRYSHLSAVSIYAISWAISTGSFPNIPRSAYNNISFMRVHRSCHPTYLDPWRLPGYVVLHCYSEVSMLLPYLRYITKRQLTNRWLFKVCVKRCCTVTSWLHFFNTEIQNPGGSGAAGKLLRTDRRASIRIYELNAVGLRHAKEVLFFFFFPGIHRRMHQGRWAVACTYGLWKCGGRSFRGVLLSVHSTCGVNDTLGWWRASDADG